MNRVRRRIISKQCVEIEQWKERVADIGTLISTIEGLAEEEREAYDNLSERLRTSDQALAMEQAADLLDEVSAELNDTIESFKDALDGIVQKLNQASEGA